MPLKTAAPLRAPHNLPREPRRVSYAWAVSLGGEAGAKLLTKFGLIEQAIDYATESGAFEHAFSLAQSSRKEKLPEVHASCVLRTLP